MGTERRKREAEYLPNWSHGWMKSFDEAVNGVDGLFHTTSPVFVQQDHNIQEALIDPISKGTTNVMNSFTKNKLL